MLQRRTSKNSKLAENNQINAWDSSNDNCADVDSNSAGNSSSNNNNNNIDNIDKNNMSAQSQSDIASNIPVEENNLTVPTKSSGTLEAPGLK